MDAAGESGGTGWRSATPQRPGLGVELARSPFLEHLRRVRELRNDVMHFEPEPLEDADLAMLRLFATFLARVVTG